VFDAIGGVVVPVRNIDDAFEFYHNRLGLTPIGIAPGKWAGFRVGEKDVWLEASTNQLPLKTGGDGGMFFVVTDIDSAAARLAERGVQPDGQGVELPSGAKQLPYRDPDGNMFLLYESPPKSNGHVS
jgi:catechol 2,3-dioxygenase-like lactoylglutathione lyase family enzyme